MLTARTQLLLLTYTAFHKAKYIDNSSNQHLDILYGVDQQRIRTQFYDAGSSLPQKTKYFAASYEKEITPRSTREINYINTPYGVLAAYIRLNNTENMYYLYKDHLGSITAITNATGTVVERRSFDAWGRMRNPDDWSYINIPPMTILERGYTGHEHLEAFGLINMNGRMYDPLIGRMLSPDPYVPNTTNSQDYNRYTYVRNNPLKYTDPDGEFILSFLSGLIRGLIQHKPPFKVAWQTMVNEAKIFKGLFVGNPLQILSRFTWEAPQTILGYSFANTSNYFGQVDEVDYWGGATTLSGDYWGQGDGAAVTLGSYITGGQDLKADPNNATFQHEYGHYLQSQSLGLFYLPIIGIPSLNSASNKSKDYSHKHFYTEQDANKRAFKFLYGKMGDDLEWNAKSNPILDKNWNHYSPTMITPATSNYINSTFSKKYAYQGIDDSYWRHIKGGKKTSVGRLSDLLLLYK